MSPQLQIITRILRRYWSRNGLVSKINNYIQYAQMIRNVSAAVQNKYLRSKITDIEMKVKSAVFNLTEEVFQYSHFVLPGCQVIECVVVVIEAPFIHTQFKQEFQLIGVSLQSTHMKRGLARRESDFATWKKWQFVYLFVSCTVEYWPIEQ